MVSKSHINSPGILVVHKIICKMEVSAQSVCVTFLIFFFLQTLYQVSGYGYRSGNCPPGVESEFLTVGPLPEYPELNDFAYIIGWEGIALRGFYDDSTREIHLVDDNSEIEPLIDGVELRRFWFKLRFNNLTDINELGCPAVTGFIFVEFPWPHEPTTECMRCWLKSLADGSVYGFDACVPCDWKIEYDMEYLLSLQITDFDPHPDCTWQKTTMHLCGCTGCDRVGFLPMDKIFRGDVMFNVQLACIQYKKK